MDLCIIICTYNRATWLRQCLDSLTQQETSPEQFETIVVDNNSTDDTKLLVEKFKNKLPNLSYVHETAQGLSHARNAGYKAAETPWVLYLDDDAKAHNDLISRCFEHIRANNVDCVGGQVLPWYPNGQPAWVPENFQTIRYDSFKPFDNVPGGIMLVRRDILQDLGGFRTDLGMRGNIVAYGEESDLVQRMLAQGKTVYVDPNMNIDHLVADYKLKLNWHFKATYAHKRDGWLMNETSPNLSHLAQECLKCLAHAIISPIKNGLRLRRAHYTGMHWALDTGNTLARHWGATVGIMRRLKG